MSDAIEKCLTPIWNKIRYIGHEMRIAMIEEQFNKETIAKEKSARTFKNKEIRLLTTYMERQTANAKIEEILAKIGVI